MPLSLLSSRLNSPSSLSHFLYERCSKPFAGPASVPVSLGLVLHACFAPVILGPDPAFELCLTTEQRGRITFLDLPKAQGAIHLLCCRGMRQPHGQLLVMQRPSQVELASWPTSCYATSCDFFVSSKAALQLICSPRLGELHPPLGAGAASRAVLGTVPCRTSPPSLGM